MDSQLKKQMQRILDDVVAERVRQVATWERSVLNGQSGWLC